MLCAPCRQSHHVGSWDTHLGILSFRCRVALVANSKKSRAEERCNKWAVSQCVCERTAKVESCDRFHAHVPICLFLATDGRKSAEPPFSADI